MASIGGFHEEEKDGNLSMVYHHPTIQTLTPSSSGEASSHDHSIQPLFLCLTTRLSISRFQKHPPIDYYTLFPFISPIEFSTRFPKHPSIHYHTVFPFRCNNKEFDATGGCDACNGSSFGTEYYCCDHCYKVYHKECVESPLKIKHPYHPEHSLQLFHYPTNYRNIECLCCGRVAQTLVYYCTICQAIMHPLCAMKPIPFFLNQPKRHNHPLTFFHRQNFLICDVCGLLRKNDPTYICARCNFVSHKDCLYSPRIIKISRHHHRISYTSSLQSGDWSCGVCHQSIINDYCAYTCRKCSDYVVHSRCAIGKDVWDGEELEGVPEEDDITQNVRPFDMISDGVILYFLHEYHLRLEVNIPNYDEKKLCQVCVCPIFEGNFYSCIKCDYIIHETCANAPRQVQHALHPHLLTLKAKSGYIDDFFICNACERVSSGFVYQCPIKKCDFDLDVRCALISEPFDYKDHKHPLFINLDREEKLICQVCERKYYKQLNCIECNFIVCFKCSTLPYKVRYKHDKHFLELLYGKEVCQKDWCEVCERDLGDTNTKVFYWCDECCTTIHIECLLGEDPYMKHDQNFKVKGMEVQILHQSIRPLCDYCKNPCQSKIFKTYTYIACSVKCGFDISIDLRKKRMGF
ncbi:DC1 [Arabidopsis suecica]|uniref:DC1 n=1 Tax=Arabidopsis suecica TaxID=45249 RepID=A0A8T1ZUV2_ARASU|nr:DC1 [Arabidopsis suecica]